MSTPSTRPSSHYTDDDGIERVHTGQEDQGGVVDKARKRAPWLDRVMRMLERYGAQGGNQFAAGITYFSVLAMFPLLMLTVAVAATVLASRPDLFQQLQDQIAGAVDGDLGTTINEILKTAVDQRGAMFGIGGLTALWSGLGWMGNLRIGISAMWNMGADEGGNFVAKKISDLLGLIGLLLAMTVAFGVTAIGSSGLTQKIFAMVGIESFPGMDYVIFFSSLVVGLIANFLVFLWMIMFMPRRKVPRTSGLQGALIGAVAFEAIKQLSTVIMASAAGNPAGAVFGPVIVLMVVMYLVWRVVLYCSAWAATTQESLAMTEPTPAPAPAIIRVREGALVRKPAGPHAPAKTNPGVALGAGAAFGVMAAGLASLFGKKK